MLETIENTTKRALKGREEVFAQLKEELDLHARIEKEIFYPALDGGNSRNRAGSL